MRGIHEDIIIYIIYMYRYEKKYNIIYLTIIRYNEADIIPCSSEEPNEEREREALRGAVLG